MGKCEASASPSAKSGTAFLRRQQEDGKRRGKSLQCQQAFLLLHPEAASPVQPQDQKESDGSRKRQKNMSQDAGELASA